MSSRTRSHRERRSTGRTRDKDGTHAIGSYRRRRSHTKLTRLVTSKPRGQPATPPAPTLSPGQKESIRRVRSAADFESLRHGKGNRSTNSSDLQYQQYVVVSEKLRELQLEIGRLNRQIRETKNESAEPMVLARTAVLTVNWLLGVVSFGLQAWRTLRGTRGKRQMSLRNSMNTALVSGLQSCSPFFVAWGFLGAEKGWKRNIGFFLSCAYSFYQIVFRKFLPLPNAISIALNLMFLIARHYFLHGLLSFSWARHLH